MNCSSIYVFKKLNSYASKYGIYHVHETVFDNTINNIYNLRQNRPMSSDTFLLIAACTEKPFYYAAILNKTIPLFMHLFLWIYK